jgi:hypothetical protein
MSGGGKGGEQTTEIKLPKDIEDAAKANLELAKKVGSLPYAPYFGPSVAAFTPAQEAAFQGADAAASAFGLPGAAAGAMPAPQSVGGMSGYSTKPFYDQAMDQVPSEILKLYNSFFFPNNQKQKSSGAQPYSPNQLTMMPNQRDAAAVSRNSMAAFK